MLDGTHRPAQSRAADVDHKASHWTTILALILLQAIVVIPFRYTTGFQERDSYRMLLGMLDSLRRGSHFVSPLLYNREVSFGYYALIYASSAPFGSRPEVLIAAMNAVSLISTILTVIPIYWVVQRLFDRATVIVCCLILCGMPVWWNTALYGHPVRPAVLLFFSGLAVLTVYGRGNRPLLVRCLVLALLTAALTFRFDTTVLFFALAAVVWYHFRGWAFIRELGFYACGSVLLFKLVQVTLPPVQGGPPADSILTLLTKYQSVGVISGHMREAVRVAFIVMCEGFTPLLLLLALPAFVIVIRRRNPSQILFTVPLIAIDSLFWIPNSSPVRHYIPMAPALSVAVAVTALFIATRLFAPSPPAVRTWVTGFAVALCCVTVSLAEVHGPRILSEMESPFLARSEEESDQLLRSRLAYDLVALQGPQPAAVVLCDSTLVAAKMELLRRGIVVQPVWYNVPGQLPLLVHEVQDNGHVFYMLEQSWVPSQVHALLSQLDIHPQAPVLVDRNNPAIHYDGARLQVFLQRTANGERLVTRSP